MTTIKTLESLKKGALLNCFNAAFSDYLIPLKLTAENLKSKIIAENIDLKKSVGAFKEDKLIGFVIHGIKREGYIKLAYNGGTGVIPSERGNGLTIKMYDFIIPKLQQAGISQLILEVISNNHPAIKSYQKIGFKTTRRLICYRGEIKIKKVNTEIQIHPITKPDWQAIGQLGEVEPSWQNSNTAIQNLGETMEILGAYRDQNICGYIVLNKSNNRIVQLAVHPERRHEKVGTAILNHVCNNYSNSTSMINVDANHESINKFLVYSGLTNFLEQKEMKFKI